MISDIAICRDVHEGKDWTQEKWQSFVEGLIDKRLFTWKDVASTMLGALNPPQVGTSLASNKTIQLNYPRRKTMGAVMDWFYSQPLGCRGCGTLLKLEADHRIPVEELGARAWNLSNIQLLCRRCNAIKRPSHKNAGRTDLTSESGLMWILFQCNPTTFSEFETLCREYGMTMANIRFKEVWALREWLTRDRGCV